MISSRKRKVLILRFSLSLTFFLFSVNNFLNYYRRNTSRPRRQTVQPLLNQRFENESNNLENSIVTFYGPNFYINQWVEIKSWFNFESVVNLKENKTATKLPLCTEIPRNIGTRINVKLTPNGFNATGNTEFEFTKNLMPGGHYRPVDCTARHRVLILIPYKNRLQNLNYFLYHMHPFLQRQELEYQIVVVEQANDNIFNKGVLMNVAFLQILGIYNMSASIEQIKFKNTANLKYSFDCVCFHDVDLLPEDDRIMYSCPQHRPRHLSLAIEKYGYKMLYTELIGGVLNFRVSHYVRVNGYSNKYWGWGGEDDDMGVRLKMAKLYYERPNINVAHYKMLDHDRRIKNPERRKLLQKATKRFMSDGLNSVNYKLVRIVKYPLFMHILVDVGEMPAELKKAFGGKLKAAAAASQSPELADIVERAKNKKSKKN